MRKYGRILIAVGVVLALFWWLIPTGGPVIQDGSTLVVELSGSYVESVDPPLLTRILSDVQIPFVGLLSELRKAEFDDRLSSVVLRIRALETGWAQIQELRDAIGRLSAAGRRTIAYLEVASFGANLEYYLASAADEIHLSPAATTPIVGLAGEYLFLGGMWEKLGIDFEVARIGRYKNAVDMLSRKEMSEAYREVANAILDSINDQFISGIAEGRGMSFDSIATAIDTAPMTPDELKALGLIDGVEFFDELIDRLGGPIVRAPDYSQVSFASVGFEPVARFALVYGSGNVVVGNGKTNSMGNTILASDTVAAALVDASVDPSIDAIIFRIDSPGGSPLASDIVWRAVQVAKRTGKPVVASLSNVAASGGYYVACGADAIVAPPGSITGSIGVFVLRPVLEDLLDKLGIGVETLTRGAHADLLLASQPLTEASRARLYDQVAAVYELFVERVAEGRSLTYEQVDALAQGRVWTGAQAVEIGLTDRLGGIREAVLLASDRLGLDPDAIELVPFPPRGSLVEQIVETLDRVAARIAPHTLLPGVAGRMQQWLEVAPWREPAFIVPFVFNIR